MTSQHRGGFGEYGGETSAFIERTFREKILLVGVALPPFKPKDTEESLLELASLVDTAGADVVAQVIQSRTAPDPATYIGRGKVDEIRTLCEYHDVDTVVFDDELSPAQQLKLERLLGRTAIDRTTVILDIFAQNAASMEGKAQVELAQLRYLLPRIRGAGHRLSQQAGGIGTRGPGETKLEVDRRRLERRIHQLERQLEEIARHRKTQAKRRERSALWKVALVGYTNAGKSTLLNRLCGSEVEVRNQLFATLDATTRRLRLPGGEELLLSDTVGFISRLPHDLVQAFASTLKVAADADLLIHVVDAAAENPQQQIAVVRSVLAEIGAGDRPELLVWNKCDRLPGGGEMGGMEVAEMEAAGLECELNGGMDGEIDGMPGEDFDEEEKSTYNENIFRALAELRDDQQSAPEKTQTVRVSAKSGLGMDDLLEALANRLWSLYPVRELLVPHSRGDVIAAVHRSGQVLVEAAEESGMRYKVRLDDASNNRFESFAVGNGSAETATNGSTQPAPSQVEISSR